MPMPPRLRAPVSTPARIQPKCGGALAAALLLCAASAAAQDKEQGSSPPAAPPSLTLEQAMEMAERYSIAGRVATETVAESESKEAQTWTMFGPKVSLDATRAWLSPDVNKAVGKTIAGQKVPERITTASLSAAQPLTALSVLAMKLRADVLTSRSARNDEKLAKQDAAFGGAEAFLRVQKATQLVEISRLSLGVVEKQRLDSQAMSRAGKLGQSDLYRFDLAWTDAKAQLAQAQNTREIALVGLAESVGAKDPAGLSVAANAESMWESRKLQVPTLAEATKAALDKRLELKNAAARAQIAEYYHLAAKLDYVPSVAAFAKYERDFEATAISIPAQGPIPAASYKKDDLRDKLSYGLNLKWEFFDWGGRWFKISEVGATANKARLALEGAASKARLETTQSLLELRFAVESLESAKASVKFAEEVHRLTNIRFLNGQASTTDVITAERDQTRARGGLANSRGDVDLAWLKFQKTIGQLPSPQELRTAQ